MSKLREWFGKYFSFPLPAEDLGFEVERRHSPWESPNAVSSPSWMSHFRLYGPSQCHRTFSGSSSKSSNHKDYSSDTESTTRIVDKRSASTSSGICSSVDQRSSISAELTNNETLNPDKNLETLATDFKADAEYSLCPNNTIHTSNGLTDKEGFCYHPASENSDSTEEHVVRSSLSDCHKTVDPCSTGIFATDEGDKDDSKDGPRSYNVNTGAAHERRSHTCKRADEVNTLDAKESDDTAMDATEKAILSDIVVADAKHHNDSSFIDHAHNSNFPRLLLPIPAVTSSKNQAVYRPIGCETSALVCRVAPIVSVQSQSHNEDMKVGEGSTLQPGRTVLWPVVAGCIKTEEHPLVTVATKNVINDTVNLTSVEIDAASSNGDDKTGKFESCGQRQNRDEEMNYSKLSEFESETIFNIIAGDFVNSKGCYCYQDGVCLTPNVAHPCSSKTDAEATVAVLTNNTPDSQYATRSSLLEFSAARETREKSASAKELLQFHQEIGMHQIDFVHENNYGVQYVDAGVQCSAGNETCAQYRDICVQCNENDLQFNEIELQTDKKRNLHQCSEQLPKVKAIDRLELLLVKNIEEIELLNEDSAECTDLPIVESVAMSRPDTVFSKIQGLSHQHHDSSFQVINWQNPGHQRDSDTHGQNDSNKLKYFFNPSFAVTEIQDHRNPNSTVDLLDQTETETNERKENGQIQQDCGGLRFSQLSKEPALAKDFPDLSQEEYYKASLKDQNIESQARNPQWSHSLETDSSPLARSECSESRNRHSEISPSRSFVESIPRKSRPVEFSDSEVVLLDLSASSLIENATDSRQGSELIINTHSSFLSSQKTNFDMQDYRTRFQVVGIQPERTFISGPETVLRDDPPTDTQFLNFQRVGLETEIVCSVANDVIEKDPKYQRAVDRERLLLTFL